MEQKMYDEYCRLGGMKDKNAYGCVSREFHHYTHLSYIGGEFIGDGETPHKNKNGCWLFPGRAEAMTAFIRDVLNGDNDEAIRIFDSVDNILGYT